MFGGLRKAIAFFAHSDDEMVCAGTLYRLARAGCEVHVHTFTPAGVAEDRAGSAEVSRDNLAVEWRKSMEVLGIPEGRSVFHGWTPSHQLCSAGQRLVQTVYDAVAGIDPDLAIIPSIHDSHPEHVALAVACEAVLRGRARVVLRCQYPWNYGNDGRPNLYVSLDIQDMDAKARVIDCYQSQQFRYQYGDMLTQYARADGLSVRLLAAEKFELLRGVI